MGAVGTGEGKAGSRVGVVRGGRWRQASANSTPAHAHEMSSHTNEGIELAVKGKAKCARRTSTPPLAARTHGGTTAMVR